MNPKQASAICIKSHHCYNRAVTDGLTGTSMQKVNDFYLCTECVYVKEHVNGQTVLSVDSRRL